MVVDAAQAFAHVPIDDCLSVSDFTIAGCHKWLGGYFPLGVAFYSQLSNGGFIERTADDILKTTELDDALFRFCGRPCSTEFAGYSETVNLGPLFSCCGAVTDTPTSVRSINESMLHLYANARRVAHMAHHSRWRPLMPDRAFRTGIVLLENLTGAGQVAAGEAVRRFFQHRGVIATGYDGGLVRLSMPKQPFSQSELQQLARVFQRHHPNVRVPHAGSEVQQDFPIVNVS